MQLFDGALGGDISGGKVDGGGGGNVVDPFYSLEGRLDLGSVEAADVAVAAVVSCDQKSLALAFGGVESGGEESESERERDTEREEREKRGGGGGRTERGEISQGVTNNNASGGEFRVEDDEIASRPFECSVVSHNPLAPKQPAVKQPAEPAAKQPVEEVAGGKRKLCELSFTGHPKIKYQHVRWQLARASLGADDTEFNPEAVRGWVSLVAQFTRAEDAVLKDNGVAPPSVAHVYSKSLLKASEVKGAVQSLHPLFEKLETEQVLGKNPVGNLANTVRKRGGIRGLRYDKTEGTRSQRSVGYFYLC